MKNGNHKTVAISLFSGCGGLDLGSHLAGIPVALSIEIDKDCVATLKLNKVFEKTKVINGDIRNISKERIKEIIQKVRPRKFIIIGGPPCQPFSKASYWVGHGRRKGVKDSRNLISEFLRVVKEANPDGFLMENVESLLHPKHKKMIKVIENSAKSLGYDFRIIRANALDYGVPQKRKRLFFIGSKNKFKFDGPLKTHAPKEISGKLRVSPYENVDKFIKKFNSSAYFEPSEITDKGTYGRELQKVPPGKNYIAISRQKGFINSKFDAGKRFWSFLLKLHPKQPSWTIAAQPGPWVGPFHWNNRRLRVPEIAALQTFPEDYKFSGTGRSIQKQIGNAVPPLLAKSMIKFLVENL